MRITVQIRFRFRFRPKGPWRFFCACKSLEAAQRTVATGNQSASHEYRIKP